MGAACLIKLGDTEVHLSGRIRTNIGCGNLQLLGSSRNEKSGKS